MMTDNLLNKKCVPCEGGMKAFTREEAEVFFPQVSGWIIDKEAKKISKEFMFKDFVEAMNFINNVAKIAEAEGHHPDIHVFYNKVTLELSTHAIGGLSENDFILAAKIDALK
jgi:4a-hydroxytetrahydrobiopterin dehydratase